VTQSRTLAPLVVAAMMLAGAAGVRRGAAIESSTLNLDIGALIGAEAFYAQGFTGTQVIVASIEGGHVWNAHDSLLHVTTQLAHPTAAAEFDRHATWMGAVIGGRGGFTNLERGIAVNATLWSGAVASAWLPPATPGGFGVNYERTVDTFAAPFVQALITGVDGQFADVVSSVFVDPQAGVQNGRDFYAQFMDAVIASSGKTWVVISGGSGPAANSIGSPASGTNGFVVGALRSELTSPPYGEIVEASSRSPTDLWIPNFDGTGINVEGARARIDITAPGANFSLAHYGGATGSNQFGGPTDSFTNAYDIEYQGAGAAAAVVAGGAALVVDAGKDLYGFNPIATDGRIVKAVLMNSAAKPTGWDNGQSTVDGVVRTTQALDYAFGAGSLNLAKAYPQYTGGTTDVPGLDGAPVNAVGWDYGRITHTPGATTTQDYLIDQPLAAGSTLTTTLVWYSTALVDLVAPAAQYGSLDNLDVQVWLAPEGVATMLVAESVSLYNSAEHLSLLLPEDGTYMIRVIENEFTWNGIGDAGTDYGLAWSVATPVGADFDLDGDVDGDDFLSWQRGVGIESGATRGQGDADGNGAVDFGDLALWKLQFGAEAGAKLAVTGVPEPAAWGLVAVAMALAPRGTHSRLKAPMRVE
jgi:hypothetical protein